VSRGVRFAQGDRTGGSRGATGGLRVAVVEAAVEVADVVAAPTAAAAPAPLPHPHQPRHSFGLLCLNASKDISIKAKHSRIPSDGENI
jgi:hypothetical protein